MRQRRGETDHAAVLVDRGRLHGRDLMLARAPCARCRGRSRATHSERSAPARLAGRRGWSRSATSPDWSVRPAPWRRRRRSPPIDSLDRCMGRLRVKRSKLTAPDFERLARTPWPMASLASSGISALSSALARSWSRKAGRVVRNSAGELRPGIGRAHVDDPDRLDPRPRRLDADRGEGSRRSATQRQNLRSAVIRRCW